MSALKGDARALADLVTLPFRVAWWFAVTTWLGGRTITRAARFALRFREALSKVSVCPRGHEVAVFGVYECACRSVHEGYAFARCRVCGQRAGWVPCPTCQLPVLSPFV